MINDIYLFTTNRCNLQCQHCLGNCSPIGNDFFPIDTLNALLNQAMIFGAKHVGLTGGEPYLHPEFSTIIKTIVEYGYTWGFVSNGQHTKTYLDLLGQYGSNLANIHISIDSTTTHLHDEIRGKEGVFQKALNAIRVYVREGYEVWINVTLNKKNQTEVGLFLDFAKKTGAVGVQFGATIPAHQNQHLVLSDKESLRLYQKISSYQNKKNVKIKIMTSLYAFGGIIFCPSLAIHTLTVNWKGEVTFCCDVQQNISVIGSLRNSSVSELIQSWLLYSTKLQINRTKLIEEGKMGEKFDTCAFCNNYFENQYF